MSSPKTSKSFLVYKKLPGHNLKLAVEVEQTTNEAQITSNI